MKKSVCSIMLLLLFFGTLTIIGHFSSTAFSVITACGCGCFLGNEAFELAKWLTSSSHNDESEARK